jgi:hypothetical protein
VAERGITTFSASSVLPSGAVAAVRAPGSGVIPVVSSSSSSSGTRKDGFFLIGYDPAAGGGRGGSSVARHCGQRLVVDRTTATARHESATRSPARP